MSLFDGSGAKLRRRLTLVSALVACAAPVVTEAQATTGARVRVRSRCGSCAATMSDSARERHEQLLLRIDSLRWDFEHERMSPEKRAQLSAEMSRAVVELQASLSGEHMAVLSGDASDVPTFARAPQAFAYATATRRGGGGGARGYLGVTFDGPSMDMLKGNERIIRFLDHPRISLVEPSSPADRAGVEAGDTLLAFNGEDVVDRQISLTKLLVPEKRITMRIRRDGNERNYRVKIDTSPDYIVSRVMPSVIIGRVAPAAPGEVRIEIPRPPDAAGPPQAMIPNMPQMPRGVWVMSDGIGGAKLQSISPGLGTALGVGSGVLVLSVGPGTPAEESGLRDGDVILRVMGTSVRTVRELRAIIERVGEDGAKLTIQRERKQREITLRW